MQDAQMGAGMHMHIRPHPHAPPHPGTAHLQLHLVHCLEVPQLAGHPLLHLRDVRLVAALRLLQLQLVLRAIPPRTTGDKP